MKKTIHILMSAVVMMLASCSQSEDLLQTDTLANDEVQVTFNVQTPDIQTRAVDAEDDEKQVSRYICQVWESSELAEGQATETIEQTESEFTLLLKKNTEYTLLLWADRGTAKTAGQTDVEAGNFYDASDLRQVTVIPTTAEGGSAELAFYACQPVTVTSSANLSGTIALTHAVAKVCLYETNIIAKNSTLSVTYTPARTFNVADGTVSGNEEAKTLDLTLDAAGVDGTAVTGGTKITRFYVLAPEKGKAECLSNLAFTLSEPQSDNEGDTNTTTKAISNVPLQANYITNIRGEFSDYTNKSFSVALDGNWESDEYEKPFPVFKVDAANHTIQIIQPGNLTKELLDEVIGSGGELLKITGPMESNDFAVLRQYFIEIDENARVDLDLSEASFRILPAFAFYDSENRVSARGLGTITLPMTCEEIHILAFHGVEAEKVIAQGVKIIGESSFGSSKIDEVQFGSAVTTIVYGAFLFPRKDLTVDFSELTNPENISIHTQNGKDEVFLALNGIPITVIVANEEMKTFFEEHKGDENVVINVKE